MDNTDLPGRAPDRPARQLVNYYHFLAVPRTAPTDMIVEAYLLKIEEADARTVERAERALAVLSDPATRAAYDQDLTARQGEAAGALVTPAPRRASARTTARSATDAVLVRPARSTPAPPRTAPNRPGGRSAAGTAPPPPSTVINLDGRWALALIPIAVLILGLFVLKGGAGTAGSGDSSNGTFNQAIIGQLAARAITAAPGPDGVQTLDVVVNGDTMSYRPDVIKVKVGVPVRFNLTAEGRDPG